MNIVSVIRIGSRDHFPPNLREAAAAAFPGAEWREIPDFSALTSASGEAPPPVFPTAAAPAAAGGELVIFGGDAPEAGIAREWRDADQLPRWGVVDFGRSETSLPVENWALPQLIHVLRSAAAAHGIQRENARLRGDLLTIARRVSHDLRTPLGGVLATVDMLAEITPDGAAAVRPLFSSVDEITKIINRTSFLLKATAQPLPKNSVRMGSVVQEAVMRLERLITRQQASLSRPPDWPQVSGVESWLEVIWWNLLHNALQHTGPAPFIELGWDRLDQGHRFWIRDHGPGVAPAARPALFRPFHLLHDPNAPRGFGLPIIRSLVELQGGTCGSYPQPEGGVCFYFTLPDGV